jgi:hypothetical protein
MEKKKRKRLFHDRIIIEEGGIFLISEQVSEYRERVGESLE